MGKVGFQSPDGVGVAPLPGSERVFDPGSKTWATPPQRNAPSYLPSGGGWLIGIRGGLAGTQLEAAIDLAKYLADPLNSDRIRAERTFPMLPFRTTQMGRGLPDPTAAPDVDSRAWAEAIGRPASISRPSTLAQALSASSPGCWSGSRFTSA